jgi:hypothetical protein
MLQPVKYQFSQKEAKITEMVKKGPKISNMLARGHIFCASCLKWY